MPVDYHATDQYDFKVAFVLQDFYHSLRENLAVQCERAIADKVMFC